MTVGTQMRPNSRPAGQLVLWTVVLLISTASCSTLSERTQPLVPTRHQVRTGGFILFSNFPLKDDPPAIPCLQALERDLASHLDFRPSARRGSSRDLCARRSKFVHPFSQVLLSGAATAACLLPGSGQSEGRLHVRQSSARGGFETRGNPRAAPWRVRRPAALAG